MFFARYLSNFLLNFVFVILSASPGHPASISRTGVEAHFNFFSPQIFPSWDCTILLRGQIESGDSAALQELLEQSQMRQGTEILCLDSTGGQLNEALRLAELLLSSGVGTKLKSGVSCLSACAVLFMAGRMYVDEFGDIPWRVMHPSARLAFHAPSLLRIEDNSGGVYTFKEIETAYGLALRSIAMLNRVMGSTSENFTNTNSQPAMKPSLVSAILSTPPGSESWLEVSTVDQAGRWNIAIGPINVFDNPMLFPRNFMQGCINSIRWGLDQQSYVSATQDHIIEHSVNMVHEDTSLTVEVLLDEVTLDGCKFDYARSAVSGTPSKGMRIFDRFFDRERLTDFERASVSIGESPVEIIQFLPPELLLGELAN